MAQNLTADTSANRAALEGEAQAVNSVMPAATMGYGSHRPKKSINKLNEQAGPELPDSNDPVEHYQALARQGINFQPQASPSTGAYFDPSSFNIRAVKDLVTDIGAQKEAAWATAKDKLDLQYGGLSRFSDAELAELGAMKDAVKDYENKKTGADLTPLMALIDSWTGSNLAANYERPMSDDERKATVFNLKTKLAQREQGMAKAKNDALIELQEKMSAGERQKINDQYEMAKYTLGQSRDLSKDERDKARDQFDRAYKMMRINLDRDALRFKTNVAGIDAATKLAQAQAKDSGKNRQAIVAGIGYAKNPKDQKAISDGARSYEVFAPNLRKMATIMEEIGPVEIGDQNVLQQLRSLAADATLHAGKVNGLGVLSKSDYKLLNEIIPVDEKTGLVNFNVDVFRNNLAAIKGILSRSENQMQRYLQRSVDGTAAERNSFVYGTNDLSTLAESETDVDRRLQLEEANAAQLEEEYNNLLDEPE